MTAAEADLATARATLTQVAGQEERDRILADKGYTPRSVYDESLKSLRSAEAAVQAAEANLRIAQNQLGHTQLLAPNDGVVTATGADPGQVVEAGQMVVEISRDAEREAVFAVAGADVARATLDMPVKVWLQAQPEVAVTGTVREISPVADSTTGTYEVRVALPSAPREMRLGAIVVGRAEAEGQEVTTPARHRTPAIRRRCRRSGWCPRTTRCTAGRSSFSSSTWSRLSSAPAWPPGRWW